MKLSLISFLFITVGSFSAPYATAASIIFNESEFNPGSWTLGSPSWINPPVGGETFSVATDRWIVGNPANSLMISQFTVDIPQGVFSVVYAPVLMNSFVYDPGTNGGILSLGASMTTMPVAAAPTSNWAGPRMFVLQNGRTYTAKSSSNWVGFEMEAPEVVNNFSGYTALDFVELVPNSGLDVNSHPDFFGPEMQFGFGLQLTSTNLNGNGELTFARAFDNVSVRFTTVPEPSCPALLGILSLAATTRRSRRAVAKTPSGRQETRRGASFRK